MQVPVIGWTPLKSLEQLGALGVFFILQAMYYCEIQRVKDDLDADALQALRMRVFGICGAVGFALVACIWPTGYFGPLSSRIRGLFVQHTRTGNPLVDSVAEHQPASTAAYWQYLHNVCYVGPIGFIACFHKKTDAKWFLILYACVAYYFSAKMVRLVLLLGPIGSALGGVAMANGLEWMLDQLADVIPGFDDAHFEDDEPIVSSPKKTSNRGSKRGGGRGGGGDISDLYKEICTSCRSTYDSPTGIQARKVGAVLCALMYVAWIPDFVYYSQEMAIGMSQPSIMFKGTLRNGQTIMVDDYREAYWWLRDNTPEDARVMAWWDYGYQISGIANRTTIADGNTWNHEHIATLGRCLTSPEKQAHRIVRHLADYVLIWTGGGGDDLAKSPHMARIGTSVYKDICPGDPTCSAFGFVDHQSMTPTPMMAESLLYKLHGHNQSPGVTVDPQRFREVFTSKYNKVRIFKVLKVSKESKNWVANPANRDCDAPGSWYCTGNYPPALKDLIGQRKDFKQLEDFNVERDEVRWVFFPTLSIFLRTRSLSTCVQHLLYCAASAVHPLPLVLKCCTLSVGGRRAL
jgi:dolichyl-diphosphooligosaccharide---protein glycosyltransferase